MNEKSPTVEIIAVGNELLLGDVLDTNTNWLCKQITGLGGKVTRAVVIGDDREAIAREVRGALRRGAKVLFTSGGLGPTQDDMTLEAVAEATSRPLSLHPEALRMVKSKYEELYRQGAVDHPRLTKARKKMAILPEGAEPLFNPVGAAPGVLLRHRGTAIICLPGVPDELKGIFTTSLSPFLKETFGSGAFFEEEVVTEFKDESMLAPILRAVSKRHPKVYVKSRPKRFGPEVRIKVTLSARGDSPEEARRLVERALEELKRKVRLVEAG